MIFLLIFFCLMCIIKLRKTDNVLREAIFGGIKKMKLKKTDFAEVCSMAENKVKNELITYTDFCQLIGKLVLVQIETDVKSLDVYERLSKLYSLKDAL